NTGAVRTHARRKGYHCYAVPRCGPAFLTPFPYRGCLKTRTPHIGDGAGQPSTSMHVRVWCTETSHDYPQETAEMETLQRVQNGGRRRLQTETQRGKRSWSRPHFCNARGRMGQAPDNAK